MDSNSVRHSVIATSEGKNHTDIREFIRSAKELNHIEKKSKITCYGISQSIS